MDEEGALLVVFVSLSLSQLRNFFLSQGLRSTCKEPALPGEQSMARVRWPSGVRALWSLGTTGTMLLLCKNPSYSKPPVSHWFLNTLLQQMPFPFALWFSQRYITQKTSLIDIRQTHPCIFQHLPSVLRTQRGKCLRSFTASQEGAKTKAWSVLLFCSRNTRPQCRAVNLKRGGEGATNTGGAHVRGDGTGSWETRLPGQRAPGVGLCWQIPRVNQMAKTLPFTHCSGLFSAILPSPACSRYRHFCIRKQRHLRGQGSLEVRIRLPR